MLSNIIQDVGGPRIRWINTMYYILGIFGPLHNIYIYIVAIYICLCQDLSLHGMYVLLSKA